MGNMIPATTPTNTGLASILPEGIRGDDTFKETISSIDQKYGGKSDEALKGLLNAYRQVGKQQEDMIRVPGEKATEAERKTFSETVRKYHGCPETIEGYSCKVAQLDDNGKPVKDAQGNAVAVQVHPDIDGLVRTVIHQAGFGNDFYNQVIQSIVEMDRKKGEQAIESLSKTFGRDYQAKINAVNADLQRMPAELQKEIVESLGDVSRIPALAKMILWYQGGRAEDTISADRTHAVGLSKGELDHKLSELQGKMKTLPRYSDEYQELNKQFDKLLEKQISMSL